MSGFEEKFYIEGSSVIDDVFLEVIDVIGIDD